MATIYGLRQTDDTTYFYVGSTKRTAEHRFKAHLAEVRQGTHKNRHFVNKVKSIGEQNIVCDVLQEIPDALRFDIERTWIQRLIDQGHKLVNRMYVDVDPAVFYGSLRSDDDCWEMTPKEFFEALRMAYSAPPVMDDPDLQWLARALQDCLRSTLETMVLRFPEQVAIDLGLMAAQENAS